MPFFLERLRGNPGAKFVPLAGALVTIGSSPKATVPIHSPVVSSCHAILIRENKSWIIKDTKNSSGIFINNIRLHPEATYTLKDKDVISVGPPDAIGLQFRCRKRRSSSSLYEEKITAEIKKQHGEQGIRKQMDKESHPSKSEYSQPTNDSFISSNINSPISSTRSTIVKSSHEGFTEDPTSKENPTKRVSVENACLHSTNTRNQSLQAVVDSLRNDLAIKEMEQEELEERLQQAEAQRSNESGRKDKQNKEKTNKRDSTDILSNISNIMETELVCSICTELFVQANTLNCGHTFCNSCIKAWRKRKNACPICRTFIRTQTRSTVLDNFIESMIENLNLEAKERRRLVVEERGVSASGSFHSILPYIDLSSRELEFVNAYQFPRESDVDTESENNSESVFEFNPIFESDTCSESAESEFSFGSYLTDSDSEYRDCS